MPYIDWEYYSSLYQEVPEETFDRLNMKASSKLDVYTRMRAKQFVIGYNEETATSFHQQVYSQIQNTVCELINAQILAGSFMVGSTAARGLSTVSMVMLT